MERGFDPAAAFPFCLAGSNNGNPPTPTTLTYNMTAGTEYDIVVFNDILLQPQFGWGLTMETVPAVDMAIGITTGGPYQPGATVPFQVDVTDLETDDADNTEVVITLPNEFDPDTIGNVVLGGTPTYACTPDAAAGTLTCTAALHPVGDTATISFDATLVSGLTDGQEIEVTAEVSAEAPPNVNPDDDTATALVVIDIPAPAPAPVIPATPARPAVVTPAFTG